MKTITLEQTNVQRMPHSSSQRWSVGVKVSVQNTPDHKKIKQAVEFGATMVFFLSLFALLFI
jgi:hypothetical protein